ncbi:MAG: response regulator [Sinobacteraceae bacterium]|nr:response regulator [Nevskiaceae bacterium]
MTPNRVLLADNDRVAVATAGRELRAAGFEVLEAFDSPTAFDVCMAHAPAAAVIDYEMSGGTGVEIAHQVANHTSVPTVLISANSDETTVQTAVTVGALAFLAKPVEMRQLIATVRLAVQRGRDFRALRVQTEQLNAALQSGRSVGVATGLLMARFRIGREEALERLRRHARSNRIRLEEVASELLRVNDETVKLHEALSHHATARKPGARCSDPGS